MRKLFMAIILLSLASPVHADWFYKLVGYTCDNKNNALIISYTGAYNESGKEMIAKKGPQQWEPDSLIATMKDEDHIGTLKTIKGECKLKDGLYKITIGPTPGNYNIQGSCGAVVSAWTEVRLGSRIVLHHYEFESDCHDRESPITTKIIIKSGSKKPIIEKMSYDEFYQ